MLNFYHYTDEEGAKNIIRSGTIQASLKSMIKGDVAYGNGVYLTELNPWTYSKHQIAMNNWVNTSDATMNKLKNYFILSIPSGNIKNTNAEGRNIFLYGNRKDLRLHKYPWVLKDYDSKETIASYKYKVTSSGPAARKQNNKMGDYIMTDEIVNGRPVFKRSRQNIFMDSKGRWSVGKDVGVDKSGIFQNSNYSLGPHQNKQWEYSNKGKGWKRDDDTLKVLAYGVMAFNFDEV